MRGLRVVLLRDIRTFFTNFYGVGFRMVDIVLQTVIFAYILASVVHPTVTGGLTYIQYFALGSLVISSFWASYNIGREVYWDRESGYLNYLMSLPIRRTEVVVGRSLGGSVRAVLTAFPLYALAALLVPTTLINVLASVGLLFVFSVGLCGLGVTISLSLREETKARLLNTLLSLTLVRSSTAMYPAVAMPVWLQLGTRLNPVTHASDSIRSVTASQLQSQIPMDAVSAVFLFTGLSGMLGAWVFSRAVEGGPAE